MALRNVLASLLFLYSCLAYPDQECQPPRGTPSTQSFPFDIQMSLNPPDNFNPNTTVSIIIRGALGKMFRDFLIQARAPYGSSSGMSMGSSSSFGMSGFGNTNYNSQFGTGNVIGTWLTMSSDARVISCQGYSDTIINSNRDSKQSVNLKWNAPRGFSGQIQFSFNMVSVDDQSWMDQIKTMDIQQSGSMGQQGQQGQWNQQGQGQWGQQGTGQQPWGSQQGQGQQPWGSGSQGQWGQQGQGSQWGQQGQGYDSTYGYPGGAGHDGYGYTVSPYGTRYYNNAVSVIASWMSIFFSILALVYRHNF